MILSRWFRLRPGPVVTGLVFLGHPLEEAATDFPLWLRANVGGSLGPVAFVVINLVGLAVVVVAMALHRRRGDLPVVPAAVGALLVLNATIHVGAALLTRGYVPGVVTALLLWAPFGALLLREGRRAGPDVLAAGIGIGVVLQGLVALTALSV